MDTVIEDLKAALSGCDDAYFEDCLPEGFTVHEEGEWTQDYKYQSVYAVVRHDSTGRFFGIQQDRSGSYHTDWYYCAPSFSSEVRKVTETVTVEKWVNVC